MGEISISYYQSPANDTAFFLLRYMPQKRSGDIPYNLLHRLTPEDYDQTALAEFLEGCDSDLDLILRVEPHFEDNCFSLTSERITKIDRMIYDHNVSLNNKIYKE